MNWLELDQKYCWHPFTQARTAAPPLVATRAQGAYIWDIDGKRYLDAVSSRWVNLHGHAHPAISEAIAQQATRMEQVMFAGITHPPAIELAQALVQHLPAPLQHVFYTDNGSTAVEVALKMACLYWINQGQQRRRFLAFEGAYHGDTFGAMPTGKSSGFYDPFSDWLFEVDFLPYPATWNDHDPAEAEAATLKALDEYLTQHHHDLVAFIAEPLVQGASGMRMTRPSLMHAITTRLQAQNIPVIFDEVMTGFGRTGRLFASDLIGVAPDIICLSKGLTGGFLPMGATIAQPHIYQAFLSDSVEHALLHGHSYTANPLGCAAALASLRLFKTEHALERVADLGAVHDQHLTQLAHHPLVEKTRRLGGIAAFDVRVKQSGYASPIAPWLRSVMMERGVLLRPMGNTVYILAPYCTSAAQLDEVYPMLHEALDQWQHAQQSKTAGDYF